MHAPVCGVVGMKAVANVSQHSFMWTGANVWDAVLEYTADRTCSRAYKQYKILFG